MVNNIENTIKQTLFNATVGAVITYVVGSLVNHSVRFLQGQAFREISFDHPIIVCVKVATVALPSFYLYCACNGNQYVSTPIRHASFEMITFASILSVIKYTDAKVTPFLSLALAITHLSWKMFAVTNRGSQLLGL